VRLVIAPKNDVVLRVGGLKYVVMAGHVSSFKVAYNRGGIGLLCAEPGNAEKRQYANGDRAGR
jgi:hypothetical protein